MDYVVCSALLALAVCMINISYDIACQWHEKLWSRMETMPERLRLPSDTSRIRFLCRNFIFKLTSTSVAQISPSIGQDMSAELMVKRLNVAGRILTA